MTIIVQDKTVDIFLKEACDVLYNSEAENSLMLGLCESFLKDEQKIKGINLFRVVLNNKTIGVAVQTPPYNLILSSLKFDEIIHLANFIFDNGFDIPGVVGPAESALEFSKVWSKMTGTSYELGMEQGIYKATTVIYPSVYGLFRLAGSEEIDIVGQWLYEFAKESLPEREKFDLNFAKDWARKAVFEKTAFLWIVDDKPVSVAHTGRPTKNGISVRAVYTPKPSRGNGYASAVVASLTDQMIKNGFQFCTLYTDLANPTSNKIYQNVGYYEVLKSKHFNFVS